VATRPIDRTQDLRNEPRDEVHYRARGTGPDGRQLQLLVVNMSARGLMARCEVEYPVGAVLRVQLPVIGAVDAEVRWSLGGRIGCQLDRTVPLAQYYSLLAAMMAR
jgi:hypothetical protein